MAKHVAAVQLINMFPDMKCNNCFSKSYPIVSLMMHSDSSSFPFQQTIPPAASIRVVRMVVVLWTESLSEILNNELYARRKQKT
jgi:hypothetical protein